MRRLAPKALTGLAVLAILAAGYAGASGGIIAPGDQAPDTRGRDHNNDLHVIRFKDAKFTLINFWATWCEPCRNEMPMLQEMYEELGPRGLRVVGITHERIEDADLGAFIEEMGLTYPVFRAGPAIKKGWSGVKGALPNSYLVDHTGKVLRRYVGASNVQIDSMQDDLRAVFDGRPMSTMVFPEKESIATYEDRIRQKKLEQARAKAAKAKKRAEETD